MHVRDCRQVRRWVLGMELGSPARAVRALNHREVIRNAVSGLGSSKSEPAF